MPYPDRDDPARFVKQLQLRTQGLVFLAQVLRRAAPQCIPFFVRHVLLHIHGSLPTRVRFLYSWVVTAEGNFGTREICGPRKSGLPVKTLFSEVTLTMTYL